MPRDKQGTKTGRATRNRLFQEALRARKRLRRQRREDREAQAAAAVPAKLSDVIDVKTGEAKKPWEDVSPSVDQPPYRSFDLKADEGWPIVDANNVTVSYSPSRPQARRVAKSMNEGS